MDGAATAPFDHHLNVSVMKRMLLLAFVAFTALSVHAQFWTTAVGTLPDPATDCMPFGLVIDGNKPATNYSLSSAIATVSGSTINVEVIFTESGFGLPTITPVNYSVSVPGPIPAGTYTVVVDYTAAGNMEISTWTIDVDACSSPPACSLDPVPLGDTLNTNGSVTLLWAPVDSSVACRVRGRELFTTTWATAAPVFAAEPSSFTVPAAFLTPGTYFEWEVQCACSISPLNATNWSIPLTFLYPSLRNSGLSETAESVRIRWDGQQLHFLQAVRGTPYTVVDAMGRLVQQGLVENAVNLDHLSNGLYWVRVGQAPAQAISVQR